MATEYALKIRDGILDARVRDLLTSAEAGFRTVDSRAEAVPFALSSDLLYVDSLYSKDEFKDLGGYSFKSNAGIWFRLRWHDTPSAAMQMLKCVLHLIDHMDNDMVLLWQNDEAVLARAGGELMLNKDADFWEIPDRLAMLDGRPYRMARMRL